MATTTKKADDSQGKNQAKKNDKTEPKTAAKKPVGKSKK